MILRRLVDSLRKQDWSTVLVEIGIVVLGVFLGIQVANWNAERQERQLEQVLIERLIFDFERIETRLIDALTRYENYLLSIEHVRDRVRIDDPPETLDAIERFRRSLGHVLASRIPAPRSPTYVEMLSSGVFDVLENNELKRTLVDYDQRQGTSMTAWNTLRDESLMYSEPINHSITLVRPVNEDEYNHVSEWDFQRMVDDPLFERALGVQISVQANNLALQISQLESATDVLQRLRREAEE